MNTLFLRLFFTTFAFTALTPLNALAIPEIDLQKRYELEVVPFITKNGIQESFTSPHDSIALQSVRIIHPQPKAVIVVINGLTETWIKYTEFFFDWYQKGYSIFSYDHRSQGLSPRLASKNPQVVHVDQFDHYVDDLETFVNNKVAPNSGKSSKLFIVGHSMGGAIASRYLQTRTHPFQKAILSTPMLELKTAPFSEPLARVFMNVLVSIGKGQSYAPGKGDDVCGSPFEENTVTNSVARHWMNELICKKHPESVTGGPSNGWVFEALKTTSIIRSHPKKITIPFLVLKAGDDSYVMNSGMDRFCSEASQCNIKLFPEAKHEILMEKDSIRDSAFQIMEQFLN